MVVALVAVVALSLAMKDALKQKVSKRAATAAPSKNRPAKPKQNAAKHKTLGDLIAENYGWKPPVPTAAPSTKPAVGAPLPPAPATANASGALREAVFNDDVCAVDRLLGAAGKTAAIEAFLERGQSRRLNDPDEIALRALLDPNARADGAAAVDGLRFLAAAQSGGRALTDLANEDPSNGAYAFFSLPARAAAGADPRDARFESARALRSPRFETGVPDLIELLAKQGLSSASHLYLATYLRSAVPLPNWGAPTAAVVRLLSADDPDFQRATLEFAERLERDALDRFDRSPATRRWNDAEFMAGVLLFEAAWPRVNPGQPLPERPPHPADDGSTNHVYDAIRSMRRASGPCDRGPMERALQDERARLRL